MGKIVDTTALVEVGTQFSMAFLNAFRAADASRKLYDILSGGKSYPSSARKTKYPILGQLTGLREWVGERVYEDLARYVYELENKTFEKSVEVPVNDYQDDQLEAYVGIPEEIGRQAYLWPEDLILQRLQNGTPAAGAPGLCFDGQHFFDIDHPLDMATVGSSTYANRFTTTALTSTNFSSVLASMQQIKGRDNRPLSFGDPSKRRLIVPPQLREVGKQIVEADYLASGATNVNKGEAQLVVVERLGNEGTVWYLADASKPTVFFQAREEPNHVGPGFDGSFDPARFERDVIRWGIKARGAAGYACPWGIARAEA